MISSGIRRIAAVPLAVLMMILSVPFCTYSADGADPDDIIMTSDPEVVALDCAELEHDDVDSSPFVYRRLAVFTEEGTLSDSYGAESAVYYCPAGDYVLDYRTEADAEAAFAKLVSEFGHDSVIPDIPIHAQNEPFTETEALSDSWGADMMQLDTVRDASNNDRELTDNVTVAILDTGVYTDHEVFEGRLAGAGVSFIEDKDLSMDESGHGTHVAGIVADCTADRVSILPIKVLTDETGLGGYTEMINGIYYAMDQGADVINMSFAVNGAGYGSYIGPAEAKADEALRTAVGSGIVCVAVAGNDNRNLDTLKTYPAISTYTVTVNAATVNAKAIDKAVAAKGGSNKYVTKIVLGKKVRKISPNAFARYSKVKTLDLKTKKLTKKAVKKSLKKSRIKTIRVKAGSKSVNKKLVKKYKKFFTKKNAGKKVTVR